MFLFSNLKLLSVFVDCGCLILIGQKMRTVEQTTEQLVRLFNLSQRSAIKNAMMVIIIRKATKM